MAIGTPEAAGGHFEVTAPNFYCLAVEQGIGYLLTG
jgi:hypothetical protein